MNPEIQAALIGLFGGILATGLGALGAYWVSVRLHDTQRKQRLCEDIREARFRLVTYLFEAAHQEGEPEEVTREARQRYQDLLLVVEKFSQLEQDSKVLQATRRFKNQILTNLKDADYRGSRMARDVRVTADHFNDVLNSITSTSSPL